MKSLKLFLTSFLFIAFTQVGIAQEKTETIKVSGSCGMCKKNIEKAAKEAGATYALWNSDKQALTVKYNNTTSGKAKIQKAIATIGYDTQDVKATEDAYNNLHECCKYERENASSTSQANCCDDKNCDQCMKDGKCAKDMSCCKDAGCDKKDCCKKA
ncbi:MAG TPA: hypothetical protein VM368_06370 [Flavisolibacter sp.]|nr:hypothetical protein [Flavisolibacter sp.]